MTHDAQPHAVRQVVTFALADDLFAFDVRDVERVLEYRAPAPVPHLPDWVAGVLDHAGCSIAVLDLRRRFSLPPAPAGLEPRIVVVMSEGEGIGVVVDRVVEVGQVAAGRLDPAPALFRGLAGDYLAGVLRRDGPPAMVLNAGRLLTATERLELLRATADV